MKRRVFAIRLMTGAALALLPVVAAADTTMSGQPTAAEAPFVRTISADLNARFPTVAAAEKAGYLRFTDEDDTGAISYASRHWTSQDPAHPSQLWYDVHGRLLGADYSVLQAQSPEPPHRFGVEPARWFKLGKHIHYGLVGPNGTMYGAVSAQHLSDAHQDPDHPTAQSLVAAGVARSTADVRFVFLFPAIWDLTVWVIPNSSGAFAEANPAVTPVHPPQKMKM
ncbi:MAG: hypothetical protein ACLPSH_20835 [Vulcanimicrobiaceae bacterium]